MFEKLNFILNNNALLRWMNGSKLICGFLSGLVAWTYFNRPDLLDPLMRALEIAGFALIPIGAAGKMVKVVVRQK